MILDKGGAGAGKVDGLETYLEGKFCAGELYMAGASQVSGCTFRCLV